MKKSKLKKILNNYMRCNPPKIVILFLLFFPFLLYFFDKFSFDNDFWFLVNSGKYIVNNGIPHIEPFTIHEGLTFICQQWLTDVIFYLIYNKFNIYGMYILMLLLNILIIFLLYKLSMLISNKVKLSLFVTIIVDVIFISSFLTTRPQAFDIILLLLELYCLEFYIKKNNKYYLLILPLISLLMINLHASFWIMLFVFLIPYLVQRMFNREFKLKPLIIVTIVMMLFGFVNPYGIEAITYLFGSYGIESINIIVNEMNPLTVSNNLIVYVYMFIIIISYIVNKNKKINIRYTLLVLGTMYLAFSHLKGILYFIIASVLILNYNFKDYFNEQKSNFKVSKYVNVSIIFLICFITFISFINKEYDKEEDNFLYDVVNILDKYASKDSIIYAGYNYGGYIEYFGYKCYIDPRAEVFLKANNKKDDIFLEYYNLENGKLYYKDFLNKYNFDYLIIGLYEDILFNYIDYDSDYALIYNKNNQVKLYKRVSDNL